MLEVGQEFAFTNGKQQHTPTETHVRLTEILTLGTENCQAAGVKEEVMNWPALRKR